MAEPPRLAAGWEDLMALPEDVKAEVLGGELWTSPRPTPTHGNIQAALSGELFSFDRGRGGPGGWWLVIEPDARLGPHDIVSPDLVGWRKSRVPNFPLERPVEIVPDWVVRLGAWTDGDVAPVPPFEALELEIGVLFPPAARDE